MAKGIFIFDGNIGAAPELTFQPGNERSEGKPRPLLKFNVKYDRLVKTNNQENPYEDKGGFWIMIDYWKNDSESLSKLLQKGMRVRIEGELRIDTWPDKEYPDQMNSGMALNASLISIMPHRLQSVSLKERLKYSENNNMNSGSIPE